MRRLGAASHLEIGITKLMKSNSWQPPSDHAAGLSLQTAESKVFQTHSDVDGPERLTAPLSRRMPSSRYPGHQSTRKPGSLVHLATRSPGRMPKDTPQLQPPQGWQSRKIRLAI